MPDVRELLGGAAGPPPPLDLDRVRARVDGRRHRRRLVGGLAALLVVLPGSLGARALLDGEPDRSEVEVAADAPGPAGPEVPEAAPSPAITGTWVENRFQVGFVPKDISVVGGSVWVVGADGVVRLDAATGEIRQRELLADPVQVLSDGDGAWVVHGARSSAPAGSSRQLTHVSDDGRLEGVVVGGGPWVDGALGPDALWLIDGTSPRLFRVERSRSEVREVALSVPPSSVEVTPDGAVVIGNESVIAVVDRESLEIAGTYAVGGRVLDAPEADRVWVDDGTRAVELRLELVDVGPSMSSDRRLGTSPPNAVEEVAGGVWVGTADALRFFAEPVDGTEVVSEWPGRVEALDADGGTVWYVDGESNEVVRLTPTDVAPPPPTTALTSDVALPEGVPDQLIGVQAGGGDLVVAETQTGEVVRVLGEFDDPDDFVSGEAEPFPFTVNSVDLGSDGYVYYGTCCEPAAGALYRVPVEGGEQEPLGFGDFPALSPDGRRLASLDLIANEVVVRDLVTGAEERRPSGISNPPMTLRVGWTADGLGTVLEEQPPQGSPTGRVVLGHDTTPEGAELRVLDDGRLEWQVDDIIGLVPGEFTVAAW